MCMYTLFLVLRQGPRSNVSQLTVRSKIGLSNTGICQEKLTVRSKIRYQFCISKRDNKIKDRTIKYMFMPGKLTVRSKIGLSNVSPQNRL